MQVELKTHVGVGVTAFHIEKVERMGGAVFEDGIAIIGGIVAHEHAVNFGLERRLTFGWLSVNSLLHHRANRRLTEHVLSAGVIIIAVTIGENDNLTGTKVDIQGDGRMDAAKIADQISVDVDPHIIVTGEVVGYPCCSVLTGESAILLGKLSAHRKTKVVMEHRARSFNAAVCKTAPAIL